MAVVFIGIFYILIILLDYLPIIKEKKKKEIFGYAILMIASFLLNFLHEAGVMIPSPNPPILKFMQSIFGE